MDSQGTKRPLEYGETPIAEKKPKTTGSDELRILLDAKTEVGAILGRGGAKITALRTDCGVVASIQKTDFDRQVAHRILYLRGDGESLLEAITRVATLLHDSIVERKARKGVTGDSGVTIRLLVDASLVGAIIGKGGRVSRSICEESGARMSISPDRMPNSTERTVSVMGAVEAVTKAAKLVIPMAIEPLRADTTAVRYVPQPAMMQQPPAAAPAAAAQPMYYQLPNGQLVAAQMVQPMMAPMGGMGQMGQQPMGQLPSLADSGLLGGMPPMPQSSMPSMPGMPAMPATGEEATAAAAIQDPTQQAQPMMQQMAAQQMGAGMGGGMAAGMGMSAGMMAAPGGPEDVTGSIEMLEGGQAKAVLSVPSAAAGGIIGKRGATIQAMRQQTGCSISLSESVQDAPTRVVTISGPTMGVQQATELVRQKVASNMPGAPRQQYAY